MDLIHVKDSALKNIPRCGFDPKDAPMAWTSVDSALKIATCAECLSDVLRDDCDCESGQIWSGCREEGCCGSSPCPRCCLDTAEDIINRRKVSA